MKMGVFIHNLSASSTKCNPIAFHHLHIGMALYTTSHICLSSILLQGFIRK